MIRNSKIFKITFISVILTGCMLFSFADRGITKKTKNKVKLNIATNNNFKKALSFNIKSGLTYKGSLISSGTDNLTPFSNKIITYQKGNTIYVVPYKQKVIVSEMRQGYTGMKLIIKSN